MGTLGMSHRRKVVSTSRHSNPAWLLGLGGQVPIISLMDGLEGPPRLPRAEALGSAGPAPFAVPLLRQRYHSDMILG